MSKKTLIACLDLLATKESAAISRNSVEHQLKLFRQFLAKSSALLISDNDSPRVRAYGDFAYIETNNTTNLINFLRTLRSWLFNEGIFFKGAIVFGRLDLHSFRNDFDDTNSDSRFFTKNWNLAEEIKSNSLESIKEIYDCVYFGLDAVNAYSKYESFKGVGLYVDRAVAETRSGEFINSVYIESEKKDSYVNYFDIKLTRQEIARFDDFINNFRKIVGKHKSYARYYIPYMICIIKSLPLTSLDVAHDDREDAQRPRSKTRRSRLIDKGIGPAVSKDNNSEVADIFNYFFVNDYFIEHFGDVPGAPLVVAKFIEAIYEQRNIIGLYSNADHEHDGLLIHVISVLSRRKTFFEKIVNIPGRTFDRKTKNHFVEIFVEYTTINNKTAQRTI